ncbi:MAG TPA: nitroreductase family protein [candidate division Zixibacteria bacterium]|nr:nitroreductase family protein [candidate division Zixibacteria bacterium]
MTGSINRDIFEVISNRRSIRKFLNKEIPKDVINKILLAGFRAPFAYQITSVVYTRDKGKMKQLNKMGIYPTTDLFMVFFFDFNRMERIVKARNYEYDFDDSLLLWIGIQDVSLVAENVVLAAEAMGLGSVLLGGAPLMVDTISEVLNVPPKVFPVVGLCLGYPDPDHLFDIRPRFPLQYTAFEDKYRELSIEELGKCMKSMDEGYITQGYYIKQNAKIPLSNKEDKIGFDKYSWSEHISRKISQGRWSEESLITILRKHGFMLE